VIAYKFLDGRGRGVFSGFSWTGRPAGAWVDTPEVVACRAGVHAARPADLAWWINEELWEVELDGAIVDAGTKLVAPRGRLRRRIDEWAGAAAAEFTRAVVFRARDAALSLGGATAELAALRDGDTVEAVQAAAVAGLAALEEGTDGHVAVGLVADTAHFAGEHICHGPFISACAAAHAASASSGRRDDWRAGLVAERAWQSAWIARRLALASS
jgi:hypothetical protein